MNLFDTYIDLPPQVKGGVIVIGNFDGVHRGHQTLLGRATSRAVELNVPCVVVTFDPHPRQVFNPDGAPFRLANRDIKAQDLLNHGATHVVSIPFTEEFSQKTPAQFIQDVLIDGLTATHVFVGADFAFGADRAGNINTLKNDDRFNTTAEPLLLNTDTPFGSRAIRGAITAGKCDVAADALGRFWLSQHIVIHGDKRGREMGYPTANMMMNSRGDFIHPAYGVYAVRAQTPDGKWHNGVANFGIRPMFEVKTPLLEVHLFDFDGDLYDQQLTVAWIGFIRGEMKFDGMDTLIAQIDNDCVRAKEILSKI